ncbi:NAD(P)H-quinone oxidoreductase [Caenispirillum bisanense]|uniref:NADPH2:quinone reductase n=1 Tax=Caenispirillum bisanense TaxID=414052 RepID=A0A286GQB2_9PROT|nr:NAD(P)H-quinone oxidoreductase [Caenispirillum bisanense]SOD97698.1 NADPH2:quinone reductase [Caenispirillum bisanense]
MAPTMTCVEITEPGSPDVLKAASRPLPAPRAGEVLIRVAVAGVNRPDVLQRQGNYPPPPGASDIPGLEVAGVVEAVGEGVTSPAPGDVVCALLSGGGYAEYAVADARLCLPVPQGFSPAEAAALPETFFTVWHNVFQRGRLQAGEAFLVHGGSSGIGTTAIQLAKAFGATVFATAGSEDKCRACRDLGADVAIDYSREDYVEVVRAKTGKGVDVILDMVGGDYIGRDMKAMAPEARHVSIAFLKGSKVQVDLMPMMLKRLTFTGSVLRSRPTDDKAAIAAELRQKVWPLLDAGRIKPVIHKVFPLAEAAAAHHLMESSAHIGKIVLDVHPADPAAVYGV